MLSGRARGLEGSVLLHTGSSSLLSCLTAALTRPWSRPQSPLTPLSTHTHSRSLSKS